MELFRDKHIAHSVNAFEQNQPVARYWDDQVMDEGISSIECNHTRITGLSSADIEDVVELTTVILRYVDSQREKEKARVLEIVRKIPIDEVLVRSHQRTVLPDLHTAGKHRKR